MIKIILMEPENSGNVGAIARVMANFDFHSLVIVNPQCDILDEDAIKRSKHACDILKNAKIAKKTYLKKFDYLVGTTAKLGTDYNLLRTPLVPQELASKLNGLSSKTSVGLLIGREGHGLFNDELDLCDFVVTIPTSSEYPTMNISHSVAVLLYELHKRFGEDRIVSTFTPIGDPEKKQILKMVDLILKDIDFSTKEKKETQKLLWKKLIGKSMLSKRESYALMGFLRKMMNKSGKK